ncbi:ATP-binding protein [Novosphingobium lindaniclasticum]
MPLNTKRYFMAEAMPSAAAPAKARLWWLVVYGAGFWLLHAAAAPWGGTGFFSLWYPAAGWRFAALWLAGAGVAPWTGLTELAVDLATGTIDLHGPRPLLDAWGVLRPSIAYALTIHVVRRLTAGSLKSAQMNLGISAVICPAAMASLTLATAVLWPEFQKTGTGAELVLSLTGLTVGDLLGVLVLAPPLLWVASLLRAPGKSSRRALPLAWRPLAVPLMQDTAILALGLGLTWLLWQAGLGLQPMPTLLAGAWIGLCHGRVAAWLAIIAILVPALPYSLQNLSQIERLELHLALVAIVVVAWLAGSFADAQRAAHDTLEKRNRLLFQAERLKTLRAMSVAVIHEISQPLSTLAIEASHLRERTAGLDEDIAESAALVDRKARTLSDLVRRLRRFGGKSADEPSQVPVRLLLNTVEQMLRPELRARGCRLVCGEIDPDLIVHIQEIELTQALVNLVRNGIAATADSVVRIDIAADADELALHVSNRSHATPMPSASEHAGMGVGLIIARTIVEAHGGSLLRTDRSENVCFTLRLPLAGNDT